MTIKQEIQKATAAAIKALYGADIAADNVAVQSTSKEFEGNFTVVMFPFVRMARKSPEMVGQEVGAYVNEHVEDIAGFNIVKGFLNLELSASYWHSFLEDNAANTSYGQLAPTGKKMMVEFSSPNTNKPLHLGHIRNILLGWSSNKILQAAGNEVVKVQIINDRGVAICKSMYAWLAYADGTTPESAGVKSDHFVGDWYVLFDRKNKEEYAEWQKTVVAKGVFEEKGREGQSEEKFFKAYKNKWFNEYSEGGKSVRALLLKWESGDPETKALWAKMNGWVYEGFESTYDRLGVSFDKLYYESNVYQAGRAIVEENVESGVFKKRDDGTIIFDLTDQGQDQKIMLRSDGTTMYITQDLATARIRYADYAPDKMIYVVADEQKYHFDVLFEALKRLGEPYAEGLFHLAYGLVELPSGRMKTREGTVVDADVLMDETIEAAKKVAEENGVYADLPLDEQKKIINQTGMAALKFFILKVSPKRKMVFNPEESVEMQGQTGPYIQYNYVRTLGVIKDADAIDMELALAYTDIKSIESEILVMLHDYPSIIQKAADDLDPALVANYCYELARAYSKFWSELSIFKAENEAAKAFRLQMSQLVNHVLGHGLDLLGIELPVRM